MSKRSAVLIAAGLVLTLGIGGLAVWLGLTGPAAGAADLAEPQQVVEVSRRTVTAPQPSSGNAASASRSPPSRWPSCTACWRVATQLESA